MVEPVNLSKFGYFANYENNYHIHDDTFIGILKRRQNFLISEDLSRKLIKSAIGNHYRTIYTVIYSKLYNCLFFGCYEGNLTQFCLSTFKTLKNYKNIGIKMIRSSATYEDYVAIGGSNGCFIIINIKKRKIISGLKKTAIGYIYSLKFVKMKKKLLLLVTGQGPNYSNNNTDVFEIISKKEVEKGSLEEKTDKSKGNKRPPNKRIQ